MKKKAVVRMALLSIVLLMAFQTLAGFWVKRELENRMKIKVEGEWSPVFFQPAFILRDVRLEWEDKVKIFSGNLRVDYNLLPLLTHNRLGVRLSSRDLNAKLLGAWAEQEGVSDIKFDLFSADLAIGKEGLEEIYGIEVKSPILKLQFGSKQNS